jgi:hypothetical protein
MDIILLVGNGEADKDDGVETGSEQARTSKQWLPTKTWTASRRNGDDSGFVLGWYKKAR